jgi:hypothetical protein
VQQTWVCSDSDWWVYVTCCCLLVLVLLQDPYATRIVEEYMPAEVRELRWPSASTCNLGPGSPPPWGTFAAARTAALDEKIQQEVQLQPRLTQVRADVAAGHGGARAAP